ncbi:MAG: type II 3-dehydroquinate dehydratase [Pseudomonadota bacterium]
MAESVVHILNGPNLNLLGEREPAIYGATTMSEIEAQCSKKATDLGLKAVFKQTNSEGGLVDLIQAARVDAAGVIINPAAYTHTSIAIADALQAVNGPIIEVHLSNVHARETFRRMSYVSPVANGVICGVGALGYQLALDAIAHLINNAR